MTYRVDMWECQEQLQRAAVWVREKYNIPSSHIVTQQFEKEFNVKIKYENPLGVAASTIEFASAGHYDMFMLRWS